MIFLVAALVGGATFAYFSDEATVANNTFAAGTLELKVDGEDYVEGISLGNMAPGDTSPYYTWVITNTGSLPGKLSISFSDIKNIAGPINNPKEAALREYYGEDYEANKNVGHLGWFLKPGKHPDVALAGLEEGKDYIMIERNDDLGYYVVDMLTDVETENSMGFSDADGTRPYRVRSTWQTGPAHPYNIPGLNGFSGKTFDTNKWLPNDVLQPGESVKFWFKVSLDEDLQGYRPGPAGTRWFDINDNIIQGDSVEFDIIFKLDQLVD
ncbi:MAG: TasA family protein [Zhaonellaceae bacterium]